MTSHQTLTRICMPRDNHSAVAARAAHARRQSASAQTIRAFRAHGQTADALTHAHGANAAQAEGVAVIWPHAPIVLPASTKEAIACDAGTVWITQGDGKDYVLAAGQSLALAPRDKVIIQAMSAHAVVRCISHTTPPNNLRCI